MRKAKPKPAWDPKIVRWEIPDAAWVRIEPVEEIRHVRKEAGHQNRRIACMQNDHFRKR